MPYLTANEGKIISMRVYEFSKEHEIPTKELLNALQTAGFSIASHMSVLTPAALDFLNEKLVKKTLSSAPQAALRTEPAPARQVSQAKAPKVPLPSPTVPTSQASMTTPQEQQVNAQERQAIKQESILSASVLKPALSSPIKPAAAKPLTAASDSFFLEEMTVADAATGLGKAVTDVILTLLKWGIVSNKNQLLTQEQVSRVATHYGVAATPRPAVKKVETSKVASTSDEHSPERLPVVVVMGHVDHGKTTLLDFIRKTRIAAKEKGGITQHLGAYQAQTPHGNVVFLDTPGHEAFSKIRSRGLKVADIAILVIAADDGIMPQTVEAIKTAQSMQVPIIVAINKIDKADKARIEVIKQSLSQYNLIPEEWGGQVIIAPISAKTGAGIDKLLELIVLQSQLMELKAQVDVPGQGYVLESRLEKGRGAVATVLLSNGTLSVGDFFIAGSTSGKVSSMMDYAGERVMQVGPSIPVSVAGFNEVPHAGDLFEAISKGDYHYAKNRPTGERAAAVHRTAGKHIINLLIKTDTDSSKEALVESIAKMNKKLEKPYSIVHASLGPVSESDAILAADTGARIVTLHVKTEPNALALIQRLAVPIESYDIIYKLLEAMQEFADRQKEVKLVLSKVGEALVRKVFDIKNVGVIAGAYVREGIFSRDGVVVAWRGNRKLAEGKITSLQRDKKTVKEVHTGYECAFMVENFNEWAIDDRVECFVMVPDKSKK